MTYPLRTLSCPLWRMLTIRYQRDPQSGEGATPPSWTLAAPFGRGWGGG